MTARTLATNFLVFFAMYMNILILFALAKYSLPYRGYKSGYALVCLFVLPLMEASLLPHSEILIRSTSRPCLICGKCRYNCLHTAALDYYSVT